MASLNNWLHSILLKDKEMQRNSDFEHVYFLLLLFHSLGKTGYLYTIANIDPARVSTGKRGWKWG